MRPVSKRLAAKAFFSAWATVLLVICSSLMVSHWVALPTPTNANTLISTASSSPDVSRSTKAFHVLLMSCPCSKRIAEHLKQRQEIQGVQEHVILVDSDSAPCDFDWTLPSHFSVSIQSTDEVARNLGIESAPMLIITQDDRGMVYCGGYTDRKQGFYIQDTQIFSAILQDQCPEPLPVLGCAVSKKLKSVVDPLGLKYSL